jgi:hypothetical protein
LASQQGVRGFLKPPGRTVTCRYLLAEDFQEVTDAIDQKRQLGLGIDDEELDPLWPAFTDDLRPQSPT